MLVVHNGFLVGAVVQANKVTRKGLRERAVRQNLTTEAGLVAHYSF